ncbi:hypothetical protein RIF29_27133 [Crotalaria pallida]|uniref:FLZ-type domain-containing protein n=1 Tax=Crotalaria pallida TaxID=3830 RepID=A0AAN9ETF9_CROPI
MQLSPSKVKVDDTPNKAMPKETTLQDKGEKAFCSLACRALEIMIDEKLEKSNSVSENSSKWESDEELFETGMLTTT